MRTSFLLNDASRVLPAKARIFGVMADPLGSSPDRLEFFFPGRRGGRILRRHVGGGVEDRAGRVGGAFRPDVEAAGRFLVLARGRDLPGAPDALTLVVAVVENVVLAEVALGPVAAAV